MTEDSHARFVDLFEADVVGSLQWVFLALGLCYVAIRLARSAGCRGSESRVWQQIRAAWPGASATDDLPAFLEFASSVARALCTDVDKR